MLAVLVCVCACSLLIKVSQAALICVGFQVVTNPRFLVFHLVYHSLYVYEFVFASHYVIYACFGNLYN